MKENEAPEKIYLQSLENNEIYNHWYRLKFNNNFIEYTRTDAFIKKACEWLKENGGSYWMDDYDLPTNELVKDFEKYIKGE